MKSWSAAGCAKLTLDGAKPESIAPVGALALWRAELQAGIHGQCIDRPATWRLDALHKAACHEAAGIEAQRAGLTAAAADAFRRAAAVVANAVAERAR
jgi:hypothetical protein